METELCSCRCESVTLWPSDEYACMYQSPLTQSGPFSIIAAVKMPQRTDLSDSQAVIFPLS